MYRKIVVKEEVEPREVLNREDAAKLLGCSLKFLDRHVKMEVIPYRRVGRRLFFSRTRLIQFIQNGGEKWQTSLSAKTPTEPAHG